jgi:predicted ATP-grasp superfamily ATP-dependent carboligase
VLYVSAGEPIRSTAWLPMPSADCVRLCDDKLLLNRRLIELGFGEHVPALLAAPSQQRPPFILKRRVAENSDDCHLVMDAQAQQRLAPLIASDDYFCQQIADGRSEYATHAVVRGGRIVAEISIEYIAQRDTFIKASEPFVTDHLTHSPCLALIERMLAAIGFEGLCCLNYKIGRDGQMQLIEINPRFGGSLAPLFFALLRRLRLAGEKRSFKPYQAVNAAAGTSPAGR